MSASNRREAFRAGRSRRSRGLPHTRRPAIATAWRGLSFDQFGVNRRAWMGFTPSVWAYTMIWPLSLIPSASWQRVAGPGGDQVLEVLTDPAAHDDRRAAASAPYNHAVVDRIWEDVEAEVGHRATAVDEP